MKIITFASQKGGTGKTTLLCNVATQFDNVNILDLDPQQNTKEWFDLRNKRKSEDCQCIDINKVQNLSLLLKEIKSINDDSILFIDTPPHTNKISEEAIKYSDVVFIPIKASPNDLRAINNTLEIVRKYKKKYYFILNQINSQTVIYKKAKEALELQGELVAIIENKNGFVLSMLNGENIFEIRERKERISKSRREITKIIEIIKEI